MGLTHTSPPSESFSVLMCCMRVVFLCLFSCYMKMSLPVFCLCCMLVFKKTEKKKNDVLYFSACGTRSGVLCYIFPRMERALALLCCIFCVWNALWHCCVILSCVWNALWNYCVIFSAHGTRSGVIVLYFSAFGTRSEVIVSYFPRVEQALALLCYILHAWNALKI